jgi:hypothetical protein
VTAHVHAISAFEGGTRVGRTSWCRRRRPSALRQRGRIGCRGARGGQRRPRARLGFAATTPQHGRRSPAPGPLPSTASSTTPTADPAPCDASDNSDTQLTPAAARRRVPHGRQAQAARNSLPAEQEVGKGVRTHGQRNRSSLEHPHQRPVELGDRATIKEGPPRSPQTGRARTSRPRPLV